MNKRTKEVLWITGIFAVEFTLISLAYLLHGVFYPTFNLYAGILIFLLIFGIFYPIYLEFTIFDTVLSILTTTSYSFLWVFSVEAGLSVYYALINITIGAILVLLIWVLHDRLVPLKGTWGQILTVKKVLYKYFPFILLILAILSVPFWAYVLLLEPSLLNFIVVLVYFAALLYVIFQTWEDIKKKYYIEKGEKHGKPKPKHRWRKASARPR